MSQRVAVFVGLLVAVGSLLCASEALAQGASLGSATEQDKAVASEQYTQGMEAFQAGNATTALEHFKKSYQAVKSPNSHLMVGKALIDLGRRAEAYDELKVTVAEAEQAAALDKKYEQTAQAARDELTALKGELVELEVTVQAPDAGTRVRVNGREYTPTEVEQPLLVAPGELTVSRVENGQVVSTESTNPAAGDKVEMTLRLPAPSEAPAAEPSVAPAVEAEATKKPFPHRRSMAYVAGGVGAAGLIGFGVFGLLNNGKYSDAKKECADGICPRDAKRDADRGYSYQTAANVSLIVGVVGAVTCVSLLLTEDGKGDGEASARLPSARVQVGLDHVTLEGTF